MISSEADTGGCCGWLRPFPLDRRELLLLAGDSGASGCFRAKAIDNESLCSTRSRQPHMSGVFWLVATVRQVLEATKLHHIWLVFCQLPIRVFDTRMVCQPFLTCPLSCYILVPLQLNVLPQLENALHVSTTDHDSHPPSVVPRESGGVGPELRALWTGSGPVRREKMREAGRRGPQSHQLLHGLIETGAPGPGEPGPKPRRKQKPVRR